MSPKIFCVRVLPDMIRFCPFDNSSSIDNHNHLSWESAQQGLGARWEADLGLFIITLRNAISLFPITSYCRRLIREKDAKPHRIATMSLISNFGK